MSGPVLRMAIRLRLLAHHTRIIETKIEQGEVSVLFEPADSKGRGG